MIFNESDRNYVLHTEASSVGSSKMKKEKKKQFFFIQRLLPFFVSSFLKRFFYYNFKFQINFLRFFF